MLLVFILVCVMGVAFVIFSCMKKALPDNKPKETKVNVERDGNTITAGDLTISVRASVKESPVEPQLDIPQDSFEVPADKVIFLDTETTGLSPEKEEILQLAIVDNDGNSLYNSYFKPRKKTSWKEAEAVNHISPEMVKDAPSFDSQKDTIQAIISNAITVIGYNANFDQRFLEANGINFNNTAHGIIEDMMWETYRHVRFEDKKLTTVAKGLGYDYKDAHDALADAKATRYIYDSINSNIKYWTMRKLKQARAIELYGKDKFQYHKVKYNAAENWDEFIAGCQLKLKEKGTV